MVGALRGLGLPPSLPKLQSLGEDGPNNLEILSLEPAGGGTALTADTVIAGQVYQLRMQVRGMQNQGLSGEPIVVSVVTDSFDELVLSSRRPLRHPGHAGRRSGAGDLYGDLSSRRPHRNLHPKSTGPAGLVCPRRDSHRAPSGSGISASYDSGAKVRNARWQPGEIDPLLGLAAMPLAMDDDEAAPLTITLTDAFGNPLDGARVVLMDPPESEQEPDPPPQDAGIADTGASVSDGPEQVPDGAIVDGSSADLGLAPRTDVGGDALSWTAAAPGILK